MSQLEAIFIWMAIGLYAFTTATYVFSLTFKSEKAFNYVNYLIAASFIAQTMGIIARYQAVGNLPTAGPYENAVATSWFIAAFTLYIALRHRSLKGIGVATMPMCMLMLGYGVLSSPQLVPMSASLKSVWLVVHVFFAWLAFGAYSVTFGLAVMYMLKGRRPDISMVEKFPSFEKMDDLIFKYLVFGFITDAVMIASGALWAKDLWGNYWSWDPIETWSLITWLIYGTAIHLRVTFGWKGKRFAWIMIFALAGMVITFFGIDWFVKSSLHMFEAWQTL